MKPIAIVTGGAGFIGSHMVDVLLARGFRVRVVDSLVGGRESNLAHHAGDPDLALERRDVRQLEPGSSLFRDARYVSHFAGMGDIAPWIEQRLDYRDTTVRGRVRVLGGARHAGVGKLVYAASSSCYGLADVPTREDHPIAPQYPYALSKYFGEAAVLHWNRVYRLPVNSIRIFNAYGTRVRTTGAYGAVFGVFFKQKLAGKPFTVVGDGTQRRDFIYATDVAQAFLLAAETEKTGEVWNLGRGNPQPVNRLVELLGGPVVYIPRRPGEPDVTWADIGKITRDLGWRPHITFEEGVARMVAEIERWRDAPLWDADSIARATQSWVQNLRALNLAALDMVDYVIVDDQPTPLENLGRIQPDFFAKGYEYQDGGVHPKTQRELEILEAYGGEILFTPGDIVYSSSAIIEAGPPDLSVDKLITLLAAEGITFDRLRAPLTKFQGVV